MRDHGRKAEPTRFECATPPRELGSFMAIPRLGHKWAPLVLRAMRQLNAESLATPAAVKDLAELLDHLAFWNDKASLTLARSPEELVDVCIADASVVALRGLPNCSNWIEAGAGAGAMGLALTILLPTIRVTLIDSLSPRVAFLRTMGSALIPGRTEALLTRSEKLASGGWEIAISRGPMTPSDWLLEGMRLGRRGVWVFPDPSSQFSADESVETSWVVHTEVRYQAPFSNSDRYAVLYVPEEDASTVR